MPRRRSVSSALDLFDRQGLPQGFAYQPDLVAPSEEAALVVWFGQLPLRAFEYHGYRGKRRVVSFGARYDFGEEALVAADAMPAALLPLREQVARRFEIEPAALAHALVTEYSPGAGIGWHRDRPMFAEVFGVSFLSACRFRLRRRAGETWQRAAVGLAPRSVYALRGEVRRSWQHSIPAAESLRYSVTFRSLSA